MMSAFVRQLAVLSLLWSFCELLMPEGRQQRLVRMTVGLMVMAALISALSGLLGGVQAVEWPSQTVFQQNEAKAEPELVYLRSVANQARQYCLRLAQKAGYQAEANVYLRRDGSLERVELKLATAEGSTVWLDEQALREQLAQAFEVEPALIHIAPLITGEAEDISP